MDTNNFAEHYFAHIPTHSPETKIESKPTYVLPELKPVEVFNPEKDRNYFARQYGQEIGYLLFLEAELRRNRIEPVYETTAENRQRLYTKPGIIYANHPSMFDVHLVLAALKDGSRNIRKDFTVLVEDEDRESVSNMTLYEELVYDFGEEHFLPARAYGATKIFTEAQKRIEAGGVFIIFPSYKSERQTDRKVLKFQNGLVYLLGRIPPKSMVYSFGINRQDALEAKEHGGKVRISEDYSTAKDWADIFQDYEADGRDTQSSLLALHTQLTHEQNLGSYKLEEIESRSNK
jgi:hypothetical protein